MSSNPLTVDSLAQIIREEDGNHSLGAGALAERIMARLPAGLFKDGALQPPLNAAIMRDAIEQITGTQVTLDQAARILGRCGILRLRAAQEE